MIAIKPLKKWFLPAINANDAWDLWNINNGETPGNKNIILATVDLGVSFPDMETTPGVDLILPDISWIAGTVSGKLNKNIQRECFE